MVSPQTALKIADASRPAAAANGQLYKPPILTSIIGAKPKEPLLQEDVQALRGFDSQENASDSLHGELLPAWSASSSHCGTAGKTRVSISPPIPAPARHRCGAWRYLSRETLT